MMLKIVNWNVAEEEVRGFISLGVGAQCSDV